MNLRIVCLALLPGVAAGANLVANGTFDNGADAAGLPGAWSVSGHRDVVQRLVVETEPGGNACARLECTAFSGESAFHHVMICQVGHVAVRRDQWYRLTFRARAREIAAGTVDLALSNTRVWQNAGLSEAFTPDTTWRTFEFVFRAGNDLAAADSRLQFWFKGTGSLWLDDVLLIETTVTQQWLPEIPTNGVKNLIPNSSFECGTAGWGGQTFGLGGWGGNLPRLEGEWDSTVAHHSKHSLRLSLSAATAPVNWFDYYEPVREPLRRSLAANLGWFRVTPGEPLTLSAWLRADAEGVTAQLAVTEAPQRPRRRAVVVGREWQRATFTFRPDQPALFVAVGLDLEASKREAATLWVDAVQLERGAQATAYETRHPIEAFLAPIGEPILTNAAPGMGFALRAYNDSDAAGQVSGSLAVLDFFDRPAVSRGVVLDVPARSGAETALTALCAGQYGYFCARWTTLATTQTVRRAVIVPAGRETVDSPLGFNHVYPWDVSVRLARQAGVVWWRDWSTKWHTVEPEQGRVDFAVPDAQIGRVLGLGGEVVALLPFPSAGWSSTARPDQVAQAAGNDPYRRARLPMAFPPANLDDFGRFAATAARHNAGLVPRPVTWVQILNEPVYTDYALPRRFGYGLTNYLHLLENASRAVRAAGPAGRILGGMGAHPDDRLTKDFVSQGGLQWVDALDVHLYDSARPAELYDAPFAALEQLMRAHGGPKPVWITEWGCYADDDPASVPQSVGDATMNRCRWPGEREATEHIVKFTAVAFGHGVRKIFFHAGTTGPVNGPDAGGVLFEHGLAPRRMYPGVAVLNRFLGAPRACAGRMHAGALWAYVFQGAGEAVAVAWCEAGGTRALALPAGAKVRDIMGNEIAGKDIVLGESPVYLTAAGADVLLDMLK
jgi:hypothetical protein